MGIVEARTADASLGARNRKCSAEEIVLRSKEHCGIRAAIDKASCAGDRGTDRFRISLEGEASSCFVDLDQT